MKSKKVWIIVGITIIVALIIISIIKGSGNQSEETVQVESPQKRDITETVVASGKVFPESEVKISSDVSGEIVELYVQEGDSVSMGQLLAKIDPDIYISNVERGEAALNSSKSQMAQAQAQVQNAIAQKEQIEAQLINAKAIFERSKNLHKDGVISSQDFEAAEASYRGLEANLRAAVASVNAAKINVDAAKFSVKSSEASLKELRTSLQRTSIFSPVNGIVSRLDVEQGERVVGTIQMTGTEMMRISNLNKMEVQVEVSENDILRVSVNDEVEIEADAYMDKKFKGVVTQIASSATSAASASGGQQLSSDQVSNFVVRISIDPNSYKDIMASGQKYPFRPGMSAAVSIATSKAENVLSIPIQSVTTRDMNEKKSGKKSGNEALEEEEEIPASVVSAQDKNEMIKEVVFVMEADSVRMVPVETGIQDDTYISILSGLDENMKVVIGPYSAVSRKLKQGTKVKVSDQSKD